MSTLAIWCRVVHSRDVRSRVFSPPVYSHWLTYLLSTWMSDARHSPNKAAYQIEILRSKRIGVTSLTFEGHVRSSVTWPFDSPYAISYRWFFGTKPLSLTVSDIFNVICNATVHVTLIRLLNKGQGHSFWYQSISHIRLPIGSIVTFALGCTVCPQYFTLQTTTDDRQTQRCTNSATISTVG